jgi:secreted trypsin-like serine protease
MSTRCPTPFAAPILVVAALALSACDAVPTGTASLAPERPSQITYGVPTGSAHPEVVLIVMDIDGSPAFRCSGTLIAPKVVLTAGHCTGEPGEFSGMRVFTESNVQTGNNNYPYAGPNTVEARAWHSHPQFTEAAFVLHDVGVIELASAVTLPAANYGQLPAANELDALQPRHGTTFTAVGYGLQRITAAFAVSEKIRMSAEPQLIQINTPFTGGFSMLLSNNAATGGTCFGDSGGPNYVASTNVVAGVTSFGLNGTCGGTGGVFRLDRADVITFVSRYLK